MNPKRDKFLTEVVMGECWHEWEIDRTKPPYEAVYCIKCRKKQRDINLAQGIRQNYDFSTPEGFFKLWNKCKVKEWWNNFWEKIYQCESFYKYQHASCIKEYYINPDRFADEVCEFLQEELKR